MTGLVPLLRTSPLLVLLGMVIAAANYRNTAAFRRRTGTSPWGIHPVIWALGSLFISVLVTVLALIAMRTTRPRAAFYPGPAPGPGPGTGGPAWLPTAPAGWVPDPSGRFHHRWWDGARWTEHVATNGVPGVDPPPDHHRTV